MSENSPIFKGMSANSAPGSPIFPEPTKDDHEIYRSPKKDYIKLLAEPDGKKSAIELSTRDQVMLNCLMHVCVQVVENQKNLPSSETISTAKELQIQLASVTDGSVPFLDQCIYGKTPIADFKKALALFLNYEDERREEYEIINNHSSVQNVWRIALTGFWAWQLQLKVPTSGKNKYQRFISIMQGGVLNPNEFDSHRLGNWVKRVWADKKSRDQANQMMFFAETMARKTSMKDLMGGT